MNEQVDTRSTYRDGFRFQFLDPHARCVALAAF